MGRAHTGGSSRGARSLKLHYFDLQIKKTNTKQVVQQIEAISVVRFALSAAITTIQSIYKIITIHSKREKNTSNPHTHSAHLEFSIVLIYREVNLKK